jgi:hypothetical protein
MDTRRWKHCASLTAGAWLVASSWAFGALQPPLTLAAKAMVVGAAFIVFWTLARVLQLRWRGRHTLLLGAWAVAAAVALEHTASAVALILVGFVALALSARGILIHEEQSRRRDRRG